jgi:hypothetical protein
MSRPMQAKITSVVITRRISVRRGDSNGTSLT